MDRAQLDTEGAGAFRPLKQPFSAKGALAPGLSSAIPTSSPTHSWTGELEFSGGAITLPDQPPISLGDVILQASQPAPPPARARGAKAAPQPPAPARDSFDLQPVPLDLGGPNPATLTGHVDDSGYTLHLSGTVLPSRLLAVGKAVPQFGDGLAECLPAPSGESEEKSGSSKAAAAAQADEEPVDVDLTATRAWGSPQSWCPNPTLLPTPPRTP
jgi:AsmA protein